ncbi:unnamed protein product [Mytilus coruscus]|uniref:Uncharacterized protein n=1 Tax=Mytilus coruscus TaxID=42192 RepID=A0A6J8EM11_MYTCO|nr:unnamed protein product [Mytilus coruscus]
MNCPSLIEDFLKHGANPNVDHESSSVLMIAFDHAKRKDIIALIRAGASKGGAGKIAIQCCKSYSELRLFIKAGISVDEIETRHGVSTLDTLFKRNFTPSKQLQIQNVVSKLLSFGANPNLAREGTDSPLILAIRNNMFEVTEKLIEAGANVNHIGEDGNNPAHYCCKSGSTANKNSTMQAMIERGLLLNNQHPCGNYLFNLIVEADFSNTVPILMIEKGADLNLDNDGYDSLLMKCVKQERYQVCCALIEKGADVSYRNAKGQTAFDIFAG